jgi:tRNA threonylcarbamoyladenosine biosynthesis protein TsaB
VLGGSPLVLAVDTTHEFGSLALVRGDETLEEVELHAPAGFGHVLYGHLAALLERQAVKVDDVDCFAAASGPGSFTGVRVGLACVKGLAEATGRPAIAISNLQALACFGTAPLRATVLDARRGEIYGAVYDSAAQLVLPEIVSKAAEWLETLPAGDLEFVSTDFDVLGDVLPPARRVVAPRALAASIAKLSVDRFRRGTRPDPASLDANYVRRSDAELFWKEQ